MKKLLIPLLFAGLAVGCSGDSPTGTDGLVPDFGIAGNSGCYTVSGRILQSGAFPTFTGGISGDIEGDVLTVGDPASVVFNGLVQHVSLSQTWEVTGGIVADLIGREVVLELESVVVFRGAPLFRNNTTARVVDGAEKGNLTYHGVLDVSGPVQTDVEYRGVICP